MRRLGWRDEDSTLSKIAPADLRPPLEFLVKADSWLAGIFGYPVFQVLPGIATSIQPGDLPAFEDRAFYFAKTATNRLDQVHALTHAGFRVVDVSVTFDRSPGQWIASSGGSVSIDDIRDDQRDAVLAIAESCFVYSRFHLDPLIPRRVADEVKRRWIESYIDKRRGERLLVAEVDGEPAGFLAVLGSSVDGRQARVIDLVGVAKSHQGKGIGRALVNRFIAASEGECEVLRVGTQASNIPSMRLYEQCGFRIAGTAYVLHAHVENGRIQG